MGYETVSTITPRTDVPQRRDWTNVGREYTEAYRAAIEAQIDGLRFSSERETAMCPALGINACIEQLGLPKVTAYATGGFLEVPDGDEGMAAYSIYGIEANDSNARVRVYVLDRGSDLIPLCTDVWPVEKPAAAAETPARPVPDGWDWIKGQRYVVTPEGRKFAVVKGRRWTRVHEYLSNGQLTARWFVDEKTGETREAEGARKPRAWRMGGEAAEFVRWIVELAHDPTGGV